MVTNSPAIMDLDTEIEQKQVDLESYREQSQEQLKNRQHTLEVQIQVLQNEVKAKQLEALDANKKLAVFEALKDSELRTQARYDQMEGNVQMLDADKGIGQQSVAVLEDATPAVPVPPEKLKHLVMAGLVGLVMGIGLMVFLDRLDDRPHSFTELEKLFDMPVLGQFPLMKTSKRKELTPILKLDDDRYPLVEASHNLRSALLYGNSFEQRPKSIVITSARPHDGKSMVSANMAITLAQTGARVLLIDADIRRGVLHEHFGAGISPGLSSVLAGECAWPAAVVKTSIPNLFLLPCGASRPNPGALFARANSFQKYQDTTITACLTRPRCWWRTTF